MLMAVCLYWCAEDMTSDRFILPTPSFNRDYYHEEMDHHCFAHRTLLFWRSLRIRDRYSDRQELVERDYFVQQRKSEEIKRLNLTREQQEKAALSMNSSGRSSQSKDGNLPVDYGGRDPPGHRTDGNLGR